MTMSFFHSKKYKAFSCQEQRDILEGLLPHNFPWLIKKSLFTDKDGDTWKIEITCLGISPGEEKQKVYMSFKIQAKSQISRNTLMKTGIHKERFHKLAMSKWQTVKLESEEKVLAKLENIETIGDNISKYHTALIEKNISLKKKRELLNDNLRKSVYSSLA